MPIQCAFLAETVERCTHRCWEACFLGPHFEECFLILPSLY